ncbi:MAG: undecaprenyldiphospho-muramoylpentapeptide beta-N-acetylglucosaminyltransferase [Myxococcota bacterium]
MSGIEGEKRILVAGGGTGGHLFPGLAVVEELRKRFSGIDVLFAGTAKGIEARVLPSRGEALELLEVTPLKGRSFGGLAASLGRLPGSLAGAASVVRRHRADLVIGVGGYASGPICLAAAGLGVPVALLEQNAHLGLTNRLLSPVVGRAYVTYAATAARFGERARVVGNPIRPELARAAKRAAADPEGFEARARGVLVFGGSQGAQALNETVPEALAAAELGGRPVVHQTGAAMRDAVEARYRELGFRIGSGPGEVTVTPFIDDMAAAYADAALVVSRAGATTLAELTAVGRPAVLVPFPHAADDHQAKNARALADAGAARAILERDLEVASLAATVSEILGDEAMRRGMAEAARRLGKPEAAADIVDDLAGWLGWTERPVPPRREPSESSYRLLLDAPSQLDVPLPPRRPLVFDGAHAWA